MQMSFLEEAIQKIEAQQPKEHTTVWGVGEQLKDMLRAEPHLAELVAQDMENKDMGLAACERKIKARADEIHKSAHSGGVCITPMEAEGIIRSFYGLPERGAAPQKKAEVIDIGDFF